AAFNAREIAAVLGAMTEDVDWPNAWEGGRLRGKEAVRDYCDSRSRSGTWVRATRACGSRSRVEAGARGLARQDVVERQDRHGPRVLGGQEDAAVGQPEAALRAERREPNRSIRAERHLLEPELGQGGSGGVEAAMP